MQLSSYFTAAENLSPAGQDNTAAFTSVDAEDKWFLQDSLRLFLKFKLILSLILALALPRNLSLTLTTM